MVPTFIVSTGRCGSTLLSRILNDHPDVLSLSEVFSLLTADPRFGGEENGPAFWRRLTAVAPVIDAVVRDGIDVPELIYPYESGRFGTSSGIPGICHMTLPMLTQAPDQLYDALAAELPHWPRRRVPEQYCRLFSWLAVRLQRRIVVERTGGSLEFLADLRQAFPDARFVYLSRDGVETALSMSRHALCRLRVLADEALRILGVSSFDQIGPEHAPRLREAFEPLLPPFGGGRLMGRDIPLTAFGELWSRMTQSGVSVLSELPAGAWTALRYERLIRSARAEITAVAEFLHLPAPAEWIARATARVDASRIGSSRLLDGDDFASLRTACAPGIEADDAAHAVIANAGAEIAPALAAG
ncbi:MAG TPA: hypothetical protein VJT49_12530 [Amycolatopsis sp.]|uniref:hypothetical protein n=1 Tax=Amycolatopsis sp. TaxID=37632 RepID=UPI002B4A74C1|nr:hypothetical protein [Amycolatopsis sp.]HKS45914.1 hypothetical protein [Amycolatopsis sp.]